MLFVIKQNKPDLESYEILADGCTLPQACKRILEDCFRFAEAQPETSKDGLCFLSDCSTKWSNNPAHLADQAEGLSLLVTRRAREVGLLDSSGSIRYGASIMVATYGISPIRCEWTLVSVPDNMDGKAAYAALRIRDLFAILISRTDIEYESYKMLRNGFNQALMSGDLEAIIKSLDIIEQVFDQECPPAEENSRRMLRQRLEIIRAWVNDVFAPKADVEKNVIYHWEGFSEADFAEMKKLIKEGHAGDIDFSGNVRAGTLCFDLVGREYDNGEISLDYDVYVGGEPGYSATESGYPYDFAGGGCAATVDEIAEMDYKTFQAKAEKTFNEFISDNAGRTYSLREKAQMPLCEW